MPRRPASPRAAPRRRPPPRPRGSSRPRGRRRPSRRGRASRSRWKSRELRDGAPVPAAVLGAVGEHRAVRPDRRRDEARRPAGRLRRHPVPRLGGQLDRPAQEAFRLVPPDPARGEALERRLVGGGRRDPRAGAVVGEMRVDDRGRVLDQQPRRPQGVREVGALRLELRGEPAVEHDSLAGIERGPEGCGRPCPDRATASAGGGHNRPPAPACRRPRRGGHVRYRRMPIEVESPEQLGYGRIRHNLAESSVTDAALADLGVDLGGLVLQYGDHLGLPELRAEIAADGAGPRPGRRARHAGRGHGAVPRPHDAARGGLARRRRPAQLRHQRRDAAGDRRRRVVPRPRLRGRLGGGPRPDRARSCGPRRGSSASRRRTTRPAPRSTARRWTP